MMYDGDADWEPSFVVTDWDRTVDLIACEVTGHKEKWESFTERGETRKWSTCKRCGIALSGREWRGLIWEQMQQASFDISKRFAELFYKPNFYKGNGLRDIVDDEGREGG